LAEVLNEFAVENRSCSILVEALECLRKVAGEISLDRLLETKTKPTLPVARPEGDGPHWIETRGMDKPMPTLERAVPDSGCIIPFAVAAP
jgi:hypothetical protein